MQEVLETRPSRDSRETKKGSSSIRTTDSTEAKELPDLRPDVGIRNINTVKRKHMMQKKARTKTGN